jgi:uncharacterized protein (DUF2336 family)
MYWKRLNKRQKGILAALKSLGGRASTYAIAGLAGQDHKCVTQALRSMHYRVSYLGLMGGYPVWKLGWAQS